jgi:hypothetical protein
MLSPEDKVIELTQINGIWVRGNPDEVPQDHLIDCQNVALVSKGKWVTRNGLNTVQAIGYTNAHVVNFFQSSILPSPAATDTVDVLNWIFMDDASNLYVNSASSPLINLGGASDIAYLNLFNRTFISPNIGRLGFKTGYLQIYYSYNGNFLIRNAAGPAPRSTTANFTAANTGTAGNTPVGVHQYAVIYQTDTGFQTSPGPKVDLTGSPWIWAVVAGNPTTLISAVPINFVAGDSIQITGATGAWTALNDFWNISVKVSTYNGLTELTVPLDSTSFGGFTGTITVHGEFYPASVNADGIHTVQLTNIPTGPSYVVQRIILATQAGGAEFFYVPNGIIYDNTTTTFDVDFFDTDLVISADELFNLMEVIPGGTGLCSYNGRLVIAGAFFYDQTALLSNVSDPESIDNVTGYVTIPIQNDGNSLVACGILRDILYLFREVGFWNTQDNGGDPSTWPVTVTDLTVGSYQKGLSGFTTTQSGASDTGDILLISAREGIYIFDGTVRRPELTFKIQDIWSSIPVAVGSGGFNNVQVSQSVWTHQIFIAYPSTPTSSYADALLVGDYDPIPGVLDPIGIRWSRFVFPWTPTAIKTGANLYVASVQTNPGYLFTIDPTQINDYGSNAINNYLTTYLATVQPGWINFFKAFRLRINANGTVSVSLYGEDNVLTATTPATGFILNILAGLTSPAGKEYLQLINFVNEKMSMKIGTNALNANMNLNRIEIFALPRWQMRPG